MGTSSSTSGSNGKAPYLPPWCPPPPQNLPPLLPMRFKGFRTNLGKFVESGDETNLHAALGHFARTSSGGAAVAAHRIVPMAAAGGNLIGIISDLKAGGDGRAIVGEDVGYCVGEDTDVAVQVITDAVTPNNGDADKISAAVQIALFDQFGSKQSFNPPSGNEGLFDLLKEYLSEAITCWLVAESGVSFQKVEKGGAANKAEADLRRTVKESVEKTADDDMLEGVDLSSPQEITRLQKKITRKIFREWEDY